MLARLDQIDGITGSFVNESGTLIRLSLRPGADAGKIANAVQRVFSTQVADRVPVQLGPRVAGTILRREIWQSQSQVAELAVTETGSSLGHAPALLLLCTVIGIGLLCWRCCRKRETGRVDSENA